MFLYKFISNSLRLISKLLFKIDVVGIDNIPKEGGVILAPNHKSNWDPIFIVSAIKNRTLNAVCKKELAYNSLMSKILDKLGVIPINRDVPEVSSVKKIIRFLKDGSAVVIFPEGTRVEGSELGEAKKGVAVFAIKGKAPIIPISIKTSYKLFSKVSIIIGEPIYVDEYIGKKVTDIEYTQITDKLMDSIKANLS